MIPLFSFGHIAVNHIIFYQLYNTKILPDIKFELLTWSRQNLYMFIISGKMYPLEIVEANIIRINFYILNMKDELLNVTGMYYSFL